MDKLLSAIRSRLAAGVLHHARIGFAAAVVVALAAGATTAVHAQSKKGTAKAEIPVAELMAPNALPDFVFGFVDAPVTIVEYASLTCGFCGRFHEHVIPKLKAKYIDAGKVKLHLRPFVQNNADAAGWMLAYCADGDRGAKLTQILLERQKQWVTQNPQPQLLQFAKQVGFTSETFDTCVKSDARLKQLVTFRDSAAKRFGVDQTPTVFVNGKRFAGSTFEELDKMLAPLVEPTEKK